MAVLGLIDPLGLRCGVTRLATKRLPTVNAGSGDYSGLEQNALCSVATLPTRRRSHGGGNAATLARFDARALLHPAELKASTKKNFLSGRPGEENPQNIFTGRMDAKSPCSHRQNQTNFRSAPTEVAEGCKRLIKNAITCWNYLYLSQKISETMGQKPGRSYSRQSQTARSRHGSILTCWANTTSRTKSFRIRSGSSPQN